MQIDNRLLNKLWDKAVGTPGYDKRQWSDLSNQILEANRRLGELETTRNNDKESKNS